MSWRMPPRCRGSAEIRQRFPSLSASAQKSQVDLDCDGVLATAIVVLVIGQQASDPSTIAFERALHGVLGNTLKVRIDALAADPPDAESVAQAAGTDGVVELKWAADGSKARVHCYLAREARWVDREISFGAGTASPDREATERGRLLGFAVGTMFAEEAELETAPASASSPASAPTSKPAPSAAKPAPSAAKPSSVPRDGDTAATEAPRTRSGETTRMLEFAGIASAGIHGTAEGLGASAGLRLALVGPIWARLFVSGRGGSIELAQATTRTALLGGGLALAALPSQNRFELGLRADLFTSYFEATHLSEDDAGADRRSRWLGGGDLVAEGGVHLVGGTGLFLAGGFEAMLGKTEVYTHGTRVAVVPPFRVIGEFGVRARF
jgi:hypothetical protein